MPQVRWSKEARADMDEIWLYIAQDRPRAAEKVTDEIVATCRMLAANPRVGKKRDDLAPGLQSFPVGNYIVIYRLLPGQLRVFRIVDGRRDLGKLF